MRSMNSKILVVGRTGQVAHELQRGRLAGGFRRRFRRAAADRPCAARTRRTPTSSSPARPDIVVNAAAYTAVDAAEADRDTGVRGQSRRAGGARRGLPRDRRGACPLLDRLRLRRQPRPAPMSRTTRSARSRSTAPARRRATRPSARGSTAMSSCAPRGSTARSGIISSRRCCGSAPSATGSASSTTSTARRPPPPISPPRRSRSAPRSPPARRDDGFGTFNFCGGGTTTWHGFAREIFAGAAARGLKTPRLVEPIATEAYPTPARAAAQLGARLRQDRARLRHRRAALAGIACRPASTSSSPQRRSRPSRKERRDEGHRPRRRPRHAALSRSPWRSASSCCRSTTSR